MGQISNTVLILAPSEEQLDTGQSTAWQGSGQEVWLINQVINHQR